ncbi:MAG: chromate transporter [Sphingomonadales bacterium]|nr:chromate transporter [Sphingomonadales bacterium]
MHGILVEEKRWIGEHRFLHALNCCMLLPGPEAQQLATYIGWLLHRTRGGIVAGALFVLPGAVSIMALSWIYALYGRVGPAMRCPRRSNATSAAMHAGRSEFIAMGKALGGGSGCVLLTYSHRDSRLVNQWAADHTMAIAGATPILALDMYEHAYAIDYGAEAGAYVDAFMGTVNWSSADQRFANASSS